MANVAPLAPTLTAPDNNGTVISTAISEFHWVHNDPGDPQSAASLRYKVPAGAWTTLVLDLGAVPAGTTMYQMPAGTFTSGVLIEWQMSTKDSIGQSSPWSASRFFTASAAAIPPTITAPAAASTVVASPLLVSWTIPAGLVQTYYWLQVRTAAGGAGTVVYDSGVVASTTQSVSVDLPAGSGATQYLRVLYACSGGSSNWSADRSFVNAMLPPERPLLVLTQVPGRPEVDFQIINPAPSDAGHVATTGNDLLRDGTPLNPLDLNLVGYPNIPPDHHGVDRMPGAGLVEYIARAYAASGVYVDSY